MPALIGARRPLLAARRAPLVYTIADIFAGRVGDWWSHGDLAKQWIDTGTVTPVAADGNTVGHGRGQINASDVIQITAGNRPTWHTGGYASYDGTDYLYRTTASFDLFNQGAATMVAVGKFNPAVARYLFSEGNSADNSPVYALGASDTVTAGMATAHIRGDTASGGAIMFSNTQDVQAGAFDNTLRCLLIRDTGTQIIPRLDNVVGAPVNYGIARGANAVVTNGFSICALYRNTPVSPFACDLYEIAVMSGLMTDAQEAYFCSTLSARAGLTI